MSVAMSLGAAQGQICDGHTLSSLGTWTDGRMGTGTSGKGWCDDSRWFGWKKSPFTQHSEEENIG